MTALTMDESVEQGAMPPDELPKTETKVPSDKTDTEKSSPSKTISINQELAKSYKLEGSAKSADAIEGWR